MSGAEPDGPVVEGTPATRRVHPALWFVLGAAAVLLLASLTGDGTGLFGWGWMMGLMWVWMLVPLLVAALLVALLLERRDRA